MLLRARVRRERLVRRHSRALAQVRCQTPVVGQYLLVPIMAAVLVLPACSDNAAPGKRFQAAEASKCFRDRGLTIRVLDYNPPQPDVVEIQRLGATVADVLFAASPDEAEEFAQGERPPIEIRGNTLVRWYGSESEDEQEGVRDCLS